MQYWDLRVRSDLECADDIKESRAFNLLARNSLTHGPVAVNTAYSPGSFRRHMTLHQQLQSQLIDSNSIVCSQYYPSSSKHNAITMRFV
jgi:hypothetical protein